MTKSNKKNKEYNLQGQLSRSRRWFDLDHNRLKENFMPREPYFYRKMYQIKFMGDDKKISQIFGVPICNAKITRKLQFHPAAPLIKYHQKTYNSCCLISLASDFHCINNNRAVPALVSSIEYLLTLKKENCNNIIHFANDILSNRIKIKGEQNLRYNMTMWRGKDSFDILNDINENVTLVQLLNSLGNVNNAISIVGNWIFDSNYEKALSLTQELLDLI